VINRRDGKYFIAASEKDIKVKVNSAQISGQQELSEGDVIEVARVKATFGYAD
jgi:cold shock CspA family protein